MQKMQSLDISILSMSFKNDYRWLLQKLRYRLGCTHHAEDVASEAFTQLAALPSLQDIREPRAMLTTITNRIIFHDFRRRELERNYYSYLASRPENFHISPEEQTQLLESLFLLDEALSVLSEKALKAFFLNRLDGLSYNEIAIILNVSTSMVKKYIASALGQCYLAGIRASSIR